MLHRVQLPLQYESGHLGVGLPALEVEIRIELIENHEAFRRLGFVKTSEGAHDGFDRITYIVMRKEV